MSETLNSKRIIGLNYAAMAQHGMALLIVGTIVPDLMSTFGIRESMTGLLLGIGSLGFMAGPLFAGAIIDRRGVRWALLIGFGVEIAIFVVFGVAPVFFLAVFANFALHLGASFVETSANVIPSMLSSRRSAHSVMNTVHMFFGVGAFLGPFLVGLYLNATGEWRPVMFLAMIPTAILLVWTLATKLPSPRTSPRETLASSGPFVHLGEVLRLRYAVLGSLTLMLYVGAEVGLSSWIVLYLQTQMGLSPLESASGLSILWAFILVGRFVNSLLGNRYTSFGLVALSGIGGAIGVGAFLSISSPAAAYVLIAWIGLCLAGTFPNVMAELNNRDPEKVGTVTAIMAMGAAIGAALFQWIVGAVAEAVSIKAAFVIPGVLQLAVIVTFAAAVGRKGWRMRTVAGDPDR